MTRMLKLLVSDFQIQHALQYLRKQVVQVKTFPENYYNVVFFLAFHDSFCH